MKPAVHPFPRTLGEIQRYKSHWLEVFLDFVFFMLYDSAHVCLTSLLHLYFTVQKFILWFWVYQDRTVRCICKCVCGRRSSPEKKEIERALKVSFWTNGFKQRTCVLPELQILRLCYASNNLKCIKVYLVKISWMWKYIFVGIYFLCLEGKKWR